MAQDWSLLPLDLLDTIALNLDTFEDFIYFSAVCRRWNHAWSSIKHQWKPTPVPWLLLAENTHQNPNHLRKIFNLANNKCYQFNLPETFGSRCWGSPYGWLVMASRDLSVRLFNPITKDEICFPSVEYLPFSPQSYDDEKYNTEWCLTYFLTKFVLLQMSRGGVDEFVVMALYDENECLAFARQGDRSWTSLYANKIRDYVVDVAAVGDRVFAMYENGAIRYWNIYELDTHKLGEPMDYSLDGINILNDSEEYIAIFYLLQSSSKLLVVLRYRVVLEIPNDDDDDEDIYEDEVYETRGFKVYQVNPIDKRWYEITDLGEAALIVGNNSSMSVSTLGADCLQRNCIYFTDDENISWASPKELGGHDMGVYDIKYNKLGRFYEGVDMHSKHCTPLLFIPQL